MNQRYLQSQGQDIWRIDTGLFRQGFDAVYLIGETGHWAFVDTGVNASVPRMLAALSDLGIRPVEVDWVLLTHVHLDHAGGAGGLMQALPLARLAVHARGVRHMQDPAQLVAGATAVYGEAHMRETYGDILGTPAERIESLADGMQIRVGSRVLDVLDTPGHARHHVCYHDARSASVFTGDTFGISYPEFMLGDCRFVMPTSTPVQFDPEALKTSIRRMLALSPTRMFLTHFGAVEPTQDVVERLLAQIDFYASVANEAAHAGTPVDLRLRIEADLRKRLESLFGSAAGAMLDAAQLDLDLNAQGLAVWVDQLRAASR